MSKDNQSSKRNRKHVLHVSIKLLKNICESLGELKKAVVHSPEAHGPTAFLILLNFHLDYELENSIMCQIVDEGAAGSFKRS